MPAAELWRQWWAACNACCGRHGKPPTTRRCTRGNFRPWPLVVVSTSAPRASPFLQRLIGAVALRVQTYEEVEADQHANGQAVLVVVCSSAAAGLGARGFGAGDAGDVGFFAVVALMAWVAWAFLVYQIGARVLPGPGTRADVGQLLRTTGFATAPGLIRIFGVLPGLTIPSFAIAALWMLAAMIIAVRQALDYTSTPRAIAVCVLGWVLAMTLAVLFGVLFGPAVA